MGETWFTADTHFGHANVIKHSNRPFETAEEMDAGLIKAINDRVGEKDVLYHLGDFTFLNKVHEYRSQIKCRQIHLILGNHDILNRCKPHFSTVQDYLYLRHNGRRFVLCHYAMVTWASSHHGTIHLHGHSHGTLDGWKHEHTPHALSMDVGVDCCDYRPIHVEKILEWADNSIARHGIFAADHHAAE